MDMTVQSAPREREERSDAPASIPVIYIVCSPFSGSTLLALLLNLHERVATVGHTTGWDGMHPDFACSCGEPVRACPLFRFVGERLRSLGMSLDFRGFLPTKYRLFGVRRLDDALFEHVPLLRSTRAETLRDAVLSRIPAVRRHLAGIDRINVAFMEAVLAYFGASVYVDNSHSPYRLRRLGGIAELDITPVHLVRDVRGYARSAHRNYGWPLEYAARRWVRGQETILRVLGADGWPNPIRIFHEELCADPLETLDGILRQVGLEPLARIGNFLAGDCHILGNKGTLGTGRVTKPAPWEERLEKKDLAEIETACLEEIGRSRMSQSLAGLAPYFPTDI